MADIILSTLIDTFLQEGALDASQKDSIREDLGLKTTDPVTFKNLVLTGLSLTGSTATSSLDITATWNTTGAPTALKVNVTNTASDAASLLLDLQVGGVSKFKVDKNGVITSANGTLLSNMTDTWNDLGTTFTAIKMNVTDTASASASLLMDLQIGGVSKFKIDKNGRPFLERIYFNDPYGSSERYLWWTGATVAFNYGLQIDGVGLAITNGSSGIVFGAYGSGSSNQIWQGHFGSPADNFYQFGTDHATTATSQTIKSHDVTTGVGADLNLSGGAGSVAKGNVTLDGGKVTITDSNRHTSSTFDYGDVFKTLYDHGLLKPPLNAYSLTSSIEADQIVIDLTESNSAVVEHSIETRFSTDDATWSSGPSFSDTGNGGTVGMTFSGLTAETTYYFQWRSVAVNNSAVYSDWSTSVSEATIA